ncbi:MAG: hypothetical protein IJK58_03470 [Clostridia bacterium]|nr:hypothetical protein [Clostridia bacterium]
MNGKIRKIGKVCRIFSKIFTVLMIIATAALIIAGTVLVAIPSDAIRADVTGSAHVEFYGKWIDKATDEGIDELNEQIRDGKVKIDGDVITVNEVVREDDSVVLTADVGGLGFSLRKIGLALFAYALIPGALIAVFIMLEKLMKELATGDSPFTDAVVKRMKHFAISLIPFAVLKSFAAPLGTGLLLTGNYTIHLGVDLTVVFATLLIILFIMIFKHGAAIQRESDETL